MEGKYILFKKDISNVNLRVIQKANTVYKCTFFLTEEVYLERHDRTVYYVYLRFENVPENLIKLTFDSEKERDEELSKTFKVVA